MFNPRSLFTLSEAIDNRMVAKAQNFMEPTTYQKGHGLQEKVHFFSVGFSCNFLIVFLYRPFRSDSTSGSLRRPSYHRNHQSASSPVAASVLFNKSGASVAPPPLMTQMEKEDPLGVSFSPRRSMPEIKSANPNFVSQLKRNSYQEESRINVRKNGDFLLVPLPSFLFLCSLTDSVTHLLASLARIETALVGTQVAVNPMILDT